MKLKDYLTITLFTLISPFIYGYYYGVLDHHHYLPYLNSLLDSSLYRNDYYFSQPHGIYSIFNHLIVSLSKITQLNLAWTHLLLYLISLWFLYLSIYCLTKTIYKKSIISSLAVFLFILPKWAAQIGYLTHHFYFISRDLSLGLSILALTYILKKKQIAGAFLILLAALINPSIPIPVGIFWLVSILPKFKSTSFGFISIENIDWLIELKNRGTYSFPHLWKWTGWGNLGLFLALIATSWLVLKEKLFGDFLKPVKQFLFICVSLFIFHFFISSIIPVPQIIQLQLLRALNYIIILSLIVFSACLSNLWVYKNLVIKLATISALVGVYLWGDHLTGWHFLAILIIPVTLLLKSKLPKKSGNLISLSRFIVLIIATNLVINLFIIKPHVNLPFYIHYPNSLVELDHYNYWLDLQIWAQKNTLTSDVFLVPPSTSGFRSFSRRSIVGDFKDGGVIFYSSTYASKWSQRMNDLENYHQFNLDDFNRLSEKYSFDYLVVTNKHQSLNLPLVYKNQNFLVYQI